MSRIRIHQHVNPLAPYFRREPAPIEFSSIFRDIEKPLILDIGSARGRFLLELAEIQKDWNHLGIEIRQPLVIEANRIARERAFDNLHYVFGNAMLWLGRLIENIPKGKIEYVVIQFPDPWFKKRHAKRRMVNDGLVAALSDKLIKNQKIFVQTDIDFLMEEIKSIFDASGEFSSHEVDQSPFPVKSEREKSVLARGLPIYKMIFMKK
jgi:tRNA (guanine-N7-)-methyltransferase